MQLQALDRRLRQFLPEPLASHTKLGNLRHGKLVFLVDAPIWTRRLLEQTDVLMEAAHTAGVPVSGVAVKVAMMQPASTDQTPPARLSATARETLRAAAAATRDEELRARLLQLASMA